MTTIADAFKRVLVGRPFRSDQLKLETMPKRVAMPVFASDGLSSVAYAPDEILLALSLAGLVAMSFSPWIAVAVGVVMLVVVACYRLNVRAYPGGGGDYDIARDNLGGPAALTVAAALLVDYVLTVAVSIAAATHYIGITIPWLRGHEVLIGIALVIIVSIASLRGQATTGRLIAIPTYVFVGAVFITIGVGIARALWGELPAASSAQYDVLPSAGYDSGMLSLGAAFLVLRAFSSGCVALAGVETIAAGVPAFRKPRGRNAGTTLLVLGVVSVAMLVGITYLAERIGVRYVADPETQLVSASGASPAADFEQDPVLGQVALSVFSAFPPGFWLVTVMTALVLVAAANTSFAGFPGLASMLARDGFLPRQLNNRGDRLTYSNGIIVLALAAIALIVIFEASTPKLIELYLVGVFISFTLGQIGMVKHWNKRLRVLVSGKDYRRTKLYRAVNILGGVITGLVLVAVVVTKFASGAWIAIVAVAVLFVGMGLIRKHYSRVADQLAPSGDDDARSLPSSVHSIVLISQIHKPTLRALAYARAARPAYLEAVTVSVDDEATTALARQWDAMEIPVRLTVLDSPYRELMRPIIAHVARVRRRSPRDLVIVYIPEYIVGHWWEHILHNQTALRLKSRLLFVPGVMVASVPWRLLSTERLTKTHPAATGAVPELPHQQGGSE